MKVAPTVVALMQSTARPGAEDGTYSGLLGMRADEPPGHRVLQEATKAALGLTGAEPEVSDGDD